MADETSGAIFSEQDLDVAFSGPATLSNRYIVSIHPSGVRISFLERRSVDARPEFRTAVLLSYQDAIELTQLLGKMLQPIEAALNAGRQSTESSHV